MMNFTPWLFYIVAGLAVMAGSVVVLSPNPVRGALALVVTFVLTAALWLMMHAEFLAMILIVVYVGAVMTLFLFVVMMLKLDLNSLRQSLRYYVTLGFALALVVALILWVAMKVGPVSAIPWTSLVVFKEPPNVSAIGWALYRQHLYSFEIAGAILFVAMIGAIALAFRGKQNRLSQKISEQVAVRAGDRLRIVKMKSERKQ